MLLIRIIPETVRPNPNKGTGFQDGQWEDFLYDHEPIKLECGQCHAMVLHSDITDNITEFYRLAAERGIQAEIDGETYDVCPHCKGERTFEHHGYEQLGNRTWPYPAPPRRGGI